MFPSADAHIFTYDLDIPGLNGESQYDGISTISINATDVAGIHYSRVVSQKENILLLIILHRPFLLLTKIGLTSLLLIKTLPEQKIQYGWLHYQVNLYSIHWIN